MIVDYFFFFFNDTATTEIYTLSLTTLFRSRTGDVVDAQARIIFDSNDPIDTPPIFNTLDAGKPASRDRKSTRLNSSHANISYAVFCLKKKKTFHTILLSL